MRAAALAAALALLAIAPARTSAQPAPGVIPGQYIVVLTPAAQNPQQVANEHAQQHAAEVSHVYETALKGYAARIPAARLNALRADPRVQFISEDREVRAVGMVSLAAGESAPTGVRRIAAATATQAHQASAAGVAVLDTGSTHSDLMIAGGHNCVPDNNIRGRITPSRYQDQNGHGTHVAGTIAARNAGSGVVGVAPGTPIYSVRVLNNQASGSWSQIICGIDWVTQNTAGIKVANMSLVGSGATTAATCATTTDALRKAICNSSTAGITYVVAAGNTGQDFANVVPAAYPEVLTVTAISDSDGSAGAAGAAPSCRAGEADDAAATFSNFAVSQADRARTIAAPGTCITSTWLNGGLNVMWGTSMAAPHVAGSVALCIGNGGAAGPCAGLMPAGIIQKLLIDAMNHARDFPANGFAGDPGHPIPGSTKGYGYLVWAGGY